MSKIAFDIDTLSKFGDYNVKGVIGNFKDYDEYFLQLHGFMKEAREYLCDFVPNLVLSDENERNRFFNEINMIRKRFTMLGIPYTEQSLATLEYNAKFGNEEGLINQLNFFYEEINNIVKTIAISQTLNEADIHEATAYKNADKPTILAVDDKPELLTTIVNMLEDRFKVMAVTSGQAVLKLIERHTPELFILDIEMPQMNGYELAKLIREKKEYSKTPIIFLTGKNTRDAVLEAVKNGGNDFVLKPVSKDILLSKILRYLGKI